ncbi:MAG: response regulator [Candidatus Latescibacterota bacterium]
MSGVGPQVPAGEGAGLRILVVDDDWMGQALTSAILEELGYGVAVAASGSEAVSCCAQGEVDLVFMDVQMPGMDGLAATRLIRAGEAGTGRHVPVIALTGDTREEDRQACLAAGMDDYLAKPVQADLARQAIDRARAGRAEGSADCAPAASAAPPVPPTAADGEVADLLSALGLQPLAEGPAEEGETPIPAEVLARLDQEFALGVPDVVLDGEALRRLAELEERGALSVGRVTALFRDSGQEILPALRASLAVGAAPVLRREAHTLKGNARDVGAHRLASLCQELEERARDGRLDGAGELLARVETAWAEAEEALRAYLAQRQ